MYTEPTIVNADRLKCKGYVTFYLNGVRHRVVSGRPLGLRIFPNRAKTVESRRKGLEWLREELVRRLASDSYPFQADSAKDADVRMIAGGLQQLTQQLKRANKLSEEQLLEIRQILNVLTNYLPVKSDSANSTIP